MNDPKGKQHLLKPTIDGESLGVAVMDALTCSRWVLGSPRPGMTFPPEVEFDSDLYDNKQGADRYSVWIETLMERFNYKTKRALFKNMMNCNISIREGVMTIGPTHHEKLEGWGREKDDGIEDVVISADSTPVEIGAALRLAFSRCIG
ncbi:contact-dependent growth inhibition system immunity protein [Paludibacterium yongneupense]|uniref:contact-dependent growth inhibition system immunity protein n=1 Tax=Paludibacterium yongneupense TaxID=400061 RepID=UPI0012EC11DE|nr:contact-dependent growth inhibition system immunity protein [Paludibacterium yongneupense]